jgi:hypothetical protein
MDDAAGKTLQTALVEETGAARGDDKERGSQKTLPCLR